MPNYYDYNRPPDPGRRTYSGNQNNPGNTGRSGRILSVNPPKQVRTGSPEDDHFFSVRPKNQAPARKASGNSAQRSAGKRPLFSVREKTASEKVKSDEARKVRVRPEKPPMSPAKKRLILLITAAALLLSLGVGMTIWFSSYYQTNIAYGVHVNGIDMSGKTREDALHLLERQLDEKLNGIRITLTYGDQKWQITRNDITLTTALDLTLDKAVAVAREGSLSKRIKDQAEARKQQPNFASYEELEQTQLVTILASVAQQIDIPASNAELAFDTEGGASFTITDEKVGRAVDQAWLREVINNAAKSTYDFTVELSTNEVKPTVTKAELETCSNRVSFFETEISGSSKRAANIRHALSAFDGMVIEPGKTVSFNAVTGERTEANGYQEAPGINADKGLEDTLGGGVCQASTTLYNAALLAGCKIEERHRHSFPSSYVKKGFDAMVNWPNKDLKFTNTSDTPLYIHTSVTEIDGKRMAQVWFYGKKLDVVYSRRSEIVKQTDTPTAKLIEDSSGKYSEYVLYDDEAYIVVASRPGMTIDAYLVTSDLSGNKISETKLYTDEFEAIKGKHYYGKNKRPADEYPYAKSGCYLLPNAVFPSLWGTDPTDPMGGSND